MEMIIILDILKVHPEFHCGLQMAYSFYIGMCKPINGLSIFMKIIVFAYFVRWIV